MRRNTVIAFAADLLELGSDSALGRGDPRSANRQDPWRQGLDAAHWSECFTSPSKGSKNLVYASWKSIVIPKGAKVTSQEQG